MIKTALNNKRMSKQRTHKELNEDVDRLVLRLDALDKRLNRYLYGDADSRSPYDLSSHPLKRRKYV